MSEKIFILISISAMSFICTKGLHLIEPIQKKNMKFFIGNTIRLQCAVDKQYECCHFNHKNTKCQLSWKEGLPSNKSCNHKVRFVKMEDPTKFICAIELNNLTNEDVGEWSCEIQEQCGAVGEIGHLLLEDHDGKRAVAPQPKEDINLTSILIYATIGMGALLIVGTVGFFMSHQHTKNKTKVCEKHTKVTFRGNLTEERIISIVELESELTKERIAYRNEGFNTDFDIMKQTSTYGQIARQTFVSTRKKLPPSKIHLVEIDSDLKKVDSCSSPQMFSINLDTNLDNMIQTKVQLRNKDTVIEVTSMDLDNMKHAATLAQFVKPAGPRKRRPPTRYIKSFPLENCVPYE